MRSRSCDRRRASLALQLRHGGGPLVWRSSSPCVGSRSSPSMGIAPSTRRWMSVAVDMRRLLLIAGVSSHNFRSRPFEHHSQATSEPNRHASMLRA
jgi:hypothetical protein